VRIHVHRNRHPRAVCPCSTLDVRHRLRTPLEDELLELRQRLTALEHYATFSPGRTPIPTLIVKRIFLPGAELGLTGELLLWAKEQSIADDEPLFFSRKSGAGRNRRALQRGQAWLIVKEASEHAQVRVRALRASRYGPAGVAAPVHPHLFRHARVRQIVRHTKSLPLAQRQAGWARLQPAYLSIGDEEAREMMRTLTD
jgi:hypothetical protein